MSLTLVIGNKNYSSWSLRPWFALRHAGIAFDEIRLPLDTPAFDQEIGRWSPSGKVPVLHDNGFMVWESLAICEYLAERFPEARLWPADLKIRAKARSVSHEMHAGFAELRARLPMNCRKVFDDFAIHQSAKPDIERICALWRECRSEHGGRGAWLFGEFSIADAMYAPVAFRFNSYRVPLGGIEQAYLDTVLKDPAIREWLAASHAETEILAASEI